MRSDLDERADSKLGKTTGLYFIGSKVMSHHTTRRSTQFATNLKAIRMLSLALTMLVPVAVFLFLSHRVAAVNRIWDGGGPNNNWSEPLNWSGDIVPGSVDVAVFDSTSSKDATIDVNVNVAGINIAAGYSGTITQAAGVNLTVGTSDFTQAGGTFNGGSGTTTFGDRFNQTGGTFIATSGNTILNGDFASDFIKSGGTFDANGGTIVFDNGPRSIMISNAPITFRNFTKTGSSFININGTSPTVIVTGTTNLSAGTFNAGGTLRAEGDVIISSTFGGGGTIELFITGNATRTITMPAGATMPRLRVDAPNATLNTSGTGTVTFSEPVDLLNAAAINTGGVNLVFSKAIKVATNFTAGTGNLTFNLTLTHSGGTFNAGSGTTRFGSIFNQTGGTFIATSGNTILNGPNGSNFNKSGGTFDANGGTVIFENGDRSLTADNAPITFFNLTKTSSNFLNINGTSAIAVVTGTTNLNAGSLTASGTLRAEGDVIISSTFGGGSVKVEFTGAANQTYTNNGGANPTGAWTINKSPGSRVTAANSIILGASQGLTITSGSLFLNEGNDLTCGGLNIGANGRLVSESSTTITLGGNPINNGVLDLQGGGAACPQSPDTILLRSSVAGTRRNWSGTTGIYRLVDVDVRDMGGTNATTPAITVFSGTDSGNNNTNWTFNNNCPPDVSITPSTANVIVTDSQTFAAGGGFGPYTFSLVTNNSGASINSATGLYAAGATPNVVDTVRVTDFFGSTADATVNVTTGPPAQLAFTVQPTNTIAGRAFDPVVQVAVRDQFGNLVTNATNAITLEFGSNPCGGFLVVPGGNTKNAVNGIATFNGARIDTACQGYSLQATASGLANAVSNDFEIIVGPAANLLFVTQPSNAAALATIAPAVEVAVTDGFGNRVPDADHAITIAIQDNPGNGTLSGTLTRDALNGLATFDNLSINGPANNYTLVATAAGLNLHTSDTFNITRPTLIVNSADDSGQGSLRKAITDANNVVGLDEISFQFISSKPMTIAPLTNLPPISDAVRMDASNSPGPIELSGENIPSGSSIGLHFVTGGGSIIRHLTINRFGTQIRIEGSGGNRIEGCKLGTDIFGNTRLGSSTDTAIQVLSDNNLIGGNGLAATRNIIVGGFVGVDIQSGNENQIHGNYIGINFSGAFALAAGALAGVRVSNGSNNSVGSPFQHEGNVISGHANGVILQSPSGNFVFGNLIGTDSDGITALPNETGIKVLSKNNTIGEPGGRNRISGNSQSGILLAVGADSNHVALNVIGVSDIGQPLGNGTGITINSRNNVISDNEIAFNTGKGIAVVQASANTTPNGNSIISNLNTSTPRRIYSNGGLGISLTSGTGPLPNDPGDADSKVNNQQNYPELTLAITGGGNTNIKGILNSTPSSSFTLHFYSSQACDSSNSGEGEIFIGTANLSTDASGIAGFDVNLPLNLPIGHFITATATDSQGNTSEFSKCKSVSPAPVSISGGISGNTGVPLINVRVQLSGTQTGTTITDSSGNYTFSNLPGGGSYTVTPSLPNFDFNPPNRSYTNLTANQTGQDFTGTKTRFSISGQVVTPNGNSIAPQPGVIITLSGTAGRSTTTDANSKFIFNDLLAGNYTVTPNKEGFVFAPLFTDITITNSDQSANFNGQQGSPLEGRIVFQFDAFVGSVNADGGALDLFLTPNRVALSPSLSRDGRKIAFSRLISSFFQIHSMNADGSAEVRLTNSSATDTFAEWSPDGTKIAFVRIASGAKTLFVMNANGSGQTQIPVGSLTQVENPTWLSNTKLAFAASDGSDFEIYSINTDGTALTQLTTNSVADYHPAASPDGTKIVFNRGSTRSTNPASLLVMNPNGTAQTSISNQKRNADAATWSPDGNKIAFMRQVNSSLATVSLVAVNSVDGSGLQTIANNFVEQPSWSERFEIATPTGTNVNLQAGGASVSFAEVTKDGTTTFTPIPANSAGVAPNGFVIGTLAYEISTTAAFTAPVTVCLNVPPTVAPTQTAFNALSLMHNEGGVLVDRTTSRDFATRTICGSVTTLSPFVLAEIVNPNLASIVGAVFDSGGNPMSGVFVNLTGTETRATQTDSFGVFNFVNLTAGGNYNVQPKQAGYIFSDYSQNYVSLDGENVVVFTGLNGDFSISGKAVDENGNPVSGVEISLEGSASSFTTTDSNGNYAFTGLPADGLYMLAPFKNGFGFAPARQIIDALSSNQSEVNFAAGPACALGTSASSQFFLSNGGPGSVSVVTGSACSWDATASDNWIVIVSENAGTGNGIVDFEVRENFTSSARQGTITVGGQSSTIVQQGMGASCSYTISPLFATHESGGGGGSVSLTTQAECGWQAVSSASWITITSASVGMGNGTVSYSVEPNPGPSGRAATITIGGKVLAIKQK
jgi:hypothetical protein